MCGKERRGEESGVGWEGLVSLYYSEGYVYPTIGSKQVRTYKCSTPTRITIPIPSINKESNSQNLNALLYISLVIPTYLSGYGHELITYIHTNHFL